MVAGIKMLGASDKSGSAEIQTKFETIDVAPGAVLTCAGSWEKHSERILTILRVEEETGLV